MTEVNFWQPSGRRRFEAIPEGAPFFFKSHYSHGNLIVGGGFLSGWASLPMTRAWEFFGEDNGCATLREMRTRILKYRRRTLDDGCADPEIGWIMLGDVRFSEPEEAPEAPPGWSGNIVQGRSYDLSSPEGSYLEQVLDALLKRHLRLVAAHGADQGNSDSPGAISGEIFGQSRLAGVRVRWLQHRNDLATGHRATPTVGLLDECFEGHLTREPRGQRPAVPLRRPRLLRPRLSGRSPAEEDLAG